jgi:hypothetical protein
MDVCFYRERDPGKCPVYGAGIEESGVSPLLYII